jgi:ribosome-binding factor A
MATARPSRVADQLRAEIAEVIAREVHDPGIGFLTITHVKVTPDLQTARVYYTTLGDAKARKESSRALERARPFLRRQIGRRLRLKRVPELEFFFDEAIERGDRIEQILQEINAERLRPERGAGAPNAVSRWGGGAGGKRGGGRAAERARAGVGPREH